MLDIDWQQDKVDSGRHTDIKHIKMYCIGMSGAAARTGE